MPENTIVSASTNSLRQVELAVQRSREDASTASTSEVPQNNPNSVTNPVSVEVNLSQEAVELSLATSQQVQTNEEADDVQNQNVELTPPVDTDLNAQASDEAEASGQEEPVEEPPAEANQAANQFNESANEALGTFIDVVS